MLPLLCPIRTLLFFLFFIYNILQPEYTLIAQISTGTGAERTADAMTEREATAYISALTYDEKLRLNEMLKALEQKRQPAPAPQQTNGTAEQ